MSVHIQREIEKLEQRLLSLAAMVEENIKMAMRSFKDRDLEMARRVIENDRQIDFSEVELEEECLKVLALYHPVATDLRIIVATLKINNDLERVGDLATNIAGCAEKLAELPKVRGPFNVEKMADKALHLLQRSLDAFVQLDARVAHEVRFGDAEVDRLRDNAKKRIDRAIKTAPKHEEAYVLLYMVARHLERVGDHATNIAEDIIYMLEGIIVRHTKNAREPGSEQQAQEEDAEA